MFRKTAPEEKARTAFVSDEQPLPIIGQSEDATIFRSQLSVSRKF